MALLAPLPARTRVPAACPRKGGSNLHRSSRAAATTTYHDFRSSEVSAKHVHFVGIGGSGVSALAVIALSQVVIKKRRASNFLSRTSHALKQLPQGYRVSGSDLRNSEQLKRVQEEVCIALAFQITYEIVVLTRVNEGSDLLRWSLCQKCRVH